MNIFIANKNDSGRTLLKFLEQTLNGVPKSRIEKLFRKKDIRVNQKKMTDKKYIVCENDEIIVYGIDFKLKEFKKIPIQFEVIFEDQNILIVDKPEGVPVHGGDNSLDLQVLSYLKVGKINSFLPSHIGRIDKTTSGIVVYGKNYQTVRMMNEKINSFEKIYRTICDLKKSQVLEMRIHHNELDKKEYISKTNGKMSISEFNVLTNNQVEVKIKTGRKHQIRAALEYLNCPIKGDTKYGGEKANRVYLHSYQITFYGLSGQLKYLNNSSFKTGPYFK